MYLENYFSYLGTLTLGNFTRNMIHVGGQLAGYYTIQKLPVTEETGKGILSALIPCTDVAITAFLSIAAWEQRKSDPKAASKHALVALHLNAVNFYNILVDQESKMEDFTIIESNLGISRPIQTTIIGLITALSIINTKCLINAMKKDRENNHKKHDTLLPV
ncbi:MAG: hypothetical protein Q8K60_00985 [Parachlamydiaceae bacterium]|nr:hypothetical protein [Parachlamydiaceae bacterium]